MRENLMGTLNLYDGINTYRLPPSLSLFHFGITIVRNFRRSPPLFMSRAQSDCRIDGMSFIHKLREARDETKL